MKSMRNKLTIVKVGGAVVEDEGKLTQLLHDFARIDGPKVLVHGGGRKATAVAAQLGIETRMVEGRRITDRDMLRVVTMVYGGLVNKTIVARLQALSINAIGLTGADAGIIRSAKRPPVKITQRLEAPPTTTTQRLEASPTTTQRLEASPTTTTQRLEASPTTTTQRLEASPTTTQRLEASPTTIDYGFVGDVRQVDANTLKHLIDSGMTPVIAPLTHDGEGHLLNTNADTMASETAKALAPLYDVTLVFAFEKAGVLRNPDDESSVIAVIDRQAFSRYRADGTISGGMLPKIENALAATDAGVGRVVITSAQAIDGTQGTTIIA